MGIHGYVLTWAWRSSSFTDRKTTRCCRRKVGSANQRSKDVKINGQWKEDQHESASADTASLKDKHRAERVCAWTQGNIVRCDIPVPAPSSAWPRPFVNVRADAVACGDNSPQAFPSPGREDRDRRTLGLACSADLSEDGAQTW